MGGGVGGGGGLPWVQGQTAEMKGMCVETRQVRDRRTRAGLQLPQEANDLSGLQIRSL